MSFKFSKSGIVITKGDSLILPINFHRDITNASIDFCITDSNTGATVLSKTHTNHIDAYNGKTIFTLEATETDIPATCYDLTMKITLDTGVVLTFYPSTTTNTAHFHVIEQ